MTPRDPPLIEQDQRAQPGEARDHKEQTMKKMIAVAVATFFLASSGMVFTSSSFAGTNANKKTTSTNVNKNTNKQKNTNKNTNKRINSGKRNTGWTNNGWTNNNCDM